MNERDPLAPTESPLSQTLAGLREFAGCVAFIVVSLIVLRVAAPLLPAALCSTAAAVGVRWAVRLTNLSDDPVGTTRAARREEARRSVFWRRMQERLRSLKPRG